MPALWPVRPGDVLICFATNVYCPASSGVNVADHVSSEQVTVSTLTFSLSRQASTTTTGESPAAAPQVPTTVIGIELGSVVPETGTTIVTAGPGAVVPNVSSALQFVRGGLSCWSLTHS